MNRSDCNDANKYAEEVIKYYKEKAFRLILLNVQHEERLSPNLNEQLQEVSRLTQLLRDMARECDRGTCDHQRQQMVCDQIAQIINRVEQPFVPIMLELRHN
ncbi:unnamed protein product [Caenorhabditis bovis]|uniref:Uncharacterized protein n=1 Tax=Caenorhabditis bovis TaxID=2654633 RepID=A0A8S1F6Q3_9PELO|nr:unnamed protein product [Caenorhabditis bovis]